MKTLALVGKEALSDFITGGAVRRDAFLREAVKRAGELRSDRPTVPIVGTLFTDANRERLLKALEYARPRVEPRPPPDIPAWQKAALARRSDEPRLGNTCAHSGRSRWMPDHSEKQQKHISQSVF